MADAIAILKREGAIIVDPADISSVVDPDRRATTRCDRSAQGATKGKGDVNCSIVFKYGMKRDFNAWLRRWGRPLR